MNKTFPRYIARSFWGPFILGLGVFTGLLLFGSFFDRLNTFMKSSAGGWLLGRYLLYQLPYFLVKMTPMATLLGILFALSGMLSRGEWKAGMAGGWRPFEMLKPLLFCSVMAGVFQLCLQEAVAPRLYMRSEFIFEGKLRGKENWQELVKKDVSFSAGEEVFVTADVFDGRKNFMERVVANIYRDGRLFVEINARKALWQAAERRWLFEDGVLINYDASLKPSSSRFTIYQSGISVPPDSLVLERLVPEGVSIADLLRRIKRLSAVGSAVVSERTLIYCKLAAPLANLVMALIGAMMVLLIRGGSRILNFGLAVVVGFVFWAAIITGQSFGNAELLPPLAAGFGPLALFAFFSLFGLKKARVF
ncbi:MAG TPA: hypothetical protein DCL44_06925 [Elusimicrobia bacterium]|nr:hypothetical protein [Elusimicrobiota bacterium]